MTEARFWLSPELTVYPVAYVHGEDAGAILRLYLRDHPGKVKRYHPLFLDPDREEGVGNALISCGWVRGIHAVQRELSLAGTFAALHRAVPWAMTYARDRALPLIVADVLSVPDDPALALFSSQWHVLQTIKVRLDYHESLIRALETGFSGTPGRPPPL